MLSNYMPIPLLQKQRSGVKTTRTVKCSHPDTFRASFQMTAYVNVKLFTSQYNEQLLVIHCVVILNRGKDELLTFL